MPEKVLLVDDDLDTLLLVELMLQHQGYIIQTASSGLQALEMVESETPDLILLDIMMPEMDGYEVTRRLRSNPSSSDIPIIMFSARNQLEDKLMAYDAGADGFMTKLSQPRELFANMRAVLSRSKKARPLGSLQ